MLLSDILYYRTCVRTWQEERFSGIGGEGGEETCGFQRLNGRN